jgi:hypothetical protein
MSKAWGSAAMRAGAAVPAGYATLSSSSVPSTQTVSDRLVKKRARATRAMCSHSATPIIRGISMWMKKTTKNSSEFTPSSVRNERPIGSAKIGIESSKRALPSATCWAGRSQTSQ